MLKRCKNKAYYQLNIHMSLKKCSVNENAIFKLGLFVAILVFRPNFLKTPFFSKRFITKKD